MNKECMKKFTAALQKAITAAGIYIGAALLQAASTALMECANDVKKKADEKIEAVNVEADTAIKEIS